MQVESEMLYKNVFHKYIQVKYKFTKLYLQNWLKFENRLKSDSMRDILKRNAIEYEAFETEIIPSEPFGYIGVTYICAFKQK